MTALNILRAPVLRDVAHAARFPALLAVPKLEVVEGALARTVPASPKKGRGVAQLAAGSPRKRRTEAGLAPIVCARMAADSLAASPGDSGPATPLPEAATPTPSLTRSRPSFGGGEVEALLASLSLDDLETQQAALERICKLCGAAGKPADVAVCAALVDAGGVTALLRAGVVAPLLAAAAKATAGEAASDADGAAVGGAESAAAAALTALAGLCEAFPPARRKLAAVGGLQLLNVCMRGPPRGWLAAGGARVLRHMKAEQEELQKACAGAEGLLDIIQGVAPEDAATAALLRTMRAELASGLQTMRDDVASIQRQLSQARVAAIAAGSVGVVVALLALRRGPRRT